MKFYKEGNMECAFQNDVINIKRKILNASLFFLQFIFLFISYLLLVTVCFRKKATVAERL